MAGRVLQLALPDELHESLARVAQTLGLGTKEEAAIIAIADWVERRRAELDDRDPNERYFVNEALDELANREK